MFDSYQDAYDQTCDHLEKQGCRAMLDDKACAYQSEDGLTCAVGCHLPQGDWMSLQAGVAGLIDYAPKLMVHLEINDVGKEDCLNFWLNMQIAHDCNSERLGINTVLQDISQVYNLTPRTISKWELG